MLKSHNEVMVVNTKIKNHNYSYKIEYSVGLFGFTAKWVHSNLSPPIFSGKNES